MRRASFRTRRSASRSGASVGSARSIGFSSSRVNAGAAFFSASSSSPSSAVFFRRRIMLPIRCSVTSWPSLVSSRTAAPLSATARRITKRRMRSASSSESELEWDFLSSIPSCTQRSSSALFSRPNSLANSYTLVFDISCLCFFFFSFHPVCLRALHARVAQGERTNMKKNGIYLTTGCAFSGLPASMLQSRGAAAPNVPLYPSVRRSSRASARCRSAHPKNLKP